MALNKERDRSARPTVNPFISLAEYVPTFLADCRESEVTPGTLQRYEQALVNHILPRLGKTAIRDITPADIRAFLLPLREEGTSLQGQKGRDRKPKRALSRATVRQIKSVLSSVLTLAIQDGIITANPAQSVTRRRPTKAARLRSRASRGEKVKAMDLEQRNRFLAAAARRDPETYPAFMLMTLAGLRLGEALGLRWSSVEFDARQLYIHEQLAIDSTKTGEERRVDMAGALVTQLEALLAARREESFRHGVPLSPWVVFRELSERPDAKEAQMAAKRIRRAMVRTLKAAGLPQHFTPHSGRHTFCSLLIASGVSPVYVQQQAGHASVEMTVGVYGSWLPVRASGAMDRLAEGAPGTQSGNNSSRNGNIGGIPESASLPPTGTSGDVTPTRPFPG